MKDLTYLVMSDHHLGNPRNKTKEMINNLDIFFDNYTAKSQFVSVDIIFLAGDLFDSLLDFASSDIQEITLWLGRLMGFCSRHDIKLRILEGTPSHDWHQSRIAETVYKLIDKPFDFKYVDSIHIEHMQDVDLWILYVPDEATATTDLTLSVVKGIMTDLNIDKVDIACMHGSFPHQLPSAAHNAPRHDPDEYLSLVRYFITIGHIHVHTVYQRILAQGSFDRISHGEEEHKGALLCRLSQKDGNSFTFIQNKGAKIFKTVTLKSKDLDKSLLHIEKTISSIPDNSFIRIKANKDHPLYVAFDDLKVKFPMYTFSKKNIEDEENDNIIISNAITLDKEYMPITINRENIVTLIMQEVKNKHNLEHKKFTLLTSLLEANNG